MRPRSCKVLAARVTSAVSNSSCLSGGSAAFIYATSAAIVNASTGVYVVRKRYAIEWRVKLSLGGRDQIVGADREGTRNKREKRDMPGRARSDADEMTDCNDATRCDAGLLFVGTIV